MAYKINIFRHRSGKIIGDMSNHLVSDMWHHFRGGKKLVDIGGIIIAVTHLLGRNSKYFSIIHKQNSPRSKLQETMALMWHIKTN